MVRRLWSGIAVAAGLCAVAATFLFLRGEPSPPAPAVTSADAVTATPVTTVPATTRAAATARPVVAYDRYRTELQRIRAARQETQALQANERCISHQRFRKVGAEWEQAGDC